jgi:hypothetical protein
VFAAEIRKSNKFNCYSFSLHLLFN